MRQKTLLTAVVLLLMFPVSQAAAGDRLTDWLELGLTGGLSDGPGYAGQAPGAGLGLNVGTSRFRLTSGATWTAVHKTATPGGYSVGGSVGAGIFVTDRFYLTGGTTQSFSDQTVWKKRVRYAYGGAGFRWAGKRRKQGIPQELSDVRFSYYRETFSTYANSTQVYQLSYQFDRRLGTSPWCVRLNVALSAMYFLDNPYPGAAHRQGAGSNFALGLSYRPHRQ